MSRQAYAGILGLMILALVFLTSCNSSNFNTPAEAITADERNTAEHSGQHGIWSAAGGDGDDGRIAGERRVRGLHGSGDGSERHIREWNEHGNGYDQRERRGHFVNVHSQWNARSQYGDGYGCGNDGHDQLQSDEHIGACGIDHGDEWIPARRNVSARRSKRRWWRRLWIVTRIR